MLKVQQSTKTPTTVGIDIGASKIEWAVLSKTKVETSGKIDTKKNFSNADLCAIVHDIIDNSKAKLAGISVAGFVQKNKLLQMPNLPKIKNLDFEKCSKVPIVIQNDIKCASLAQWWEKKTSDSFVVISAGSGIGGAFVNNSHLVCGENNLAAEFGHMKIPFERARGSPVLIDWEKLCAGIGIEEQIRSIIRGRSSISSKKYKFENAKDIFESDSPLAKRVCKQGAFYFGMGVANIVNVLNPKEVVLAGPVAKAYLRKYKKEMMVAYSKTVIEPLAKTTIVPCRFSNPGLIGCILLTRKGKNNKITKFLC